jgi:hypothetical protein
MSTNAVFARGSEWSAVSLNDGWGDVTPEQADALSDLVIERFEELAAEAGDASIFWQPQTSEVLCHVHGQDTDEHSKWDPINPIDADLDDLRDQAIQEVWEAGCGEENPMTAQVRAVLEN